MARAARKTEIETDDEHLNAMSVLELNELLDRVLAVRDVKIAAERNEVIRELRAKMEIFGLEPDDLKPRAKGDRKQSSAKYRDPVSGRTWSGQGKTAGWMAKLEAEGRNRDEFLIQGS